MTQLTPSETELIIVFATFALGYTSYYAVAHSARLRDWFHRRQGHDAGEVAHTLVSRLVMVVGFGIVPAALLAVVGPRSLLEYGLAIRWSTRAALVIAALSVVIVIVIRFNPGRRKLTAHYPQMRLAGWGPREIGVNVAGWAAYLFAYELMFRGFLLQALLPYGVVLAISVNIALYVAVHVPKGLSEAIAAVPFGLLLCFLTIEFGTIWAAFILHLVLALANSLVAIGENSEMQYRWRATRRDDRSAAPRA